MDKEITVQVEFPKPFGKGVCQDESSVLLRPFDRLKKSSVQQEEIKILFFQATDSQLPSSLLGVFLFSNKGRIIFFPGLRDRTATKTSKSGDVWNKLIHHLTVDEDLKGLHVTTRGSQEHESFGQPKVLSEQLLHLFAMSIQNTDKLENTPEFAKMTVSTTDSDSERRLSRFENAVRKAKHEQIVLNQEYQGFLHFDFYLDQRAIKDSSKFLSNLPLSSEFHKLELPDEMDKCRLHSITLDRLEGEIVVKACRFRGTLAYESVLWSSV